ncbi:MAG TPA: hypothetical protein VK186_00285 [Candidatus Deferrimicrobium sp.]|nr:hypothetical protein [Candidatus Deferrimicrobium sp.]
MVEITVYNSIVSLYEKLGFKLEAKNLGPKKSFRYKLSSTGLMNNFSYFEATSQERKEIIWILHNTKIQSAHNDHLYYAPDIVVCLKEGAITRKLKSKREHSFVENEYLLTFVEVKHLVPFPEILFSFTGLVLEFQPTFITKPSELKKAGGLHLAPMIVFTGNSSEFADKIKEDLIARYGINIVYGTQKHGGQIADFSKLNKYNKS